MKKIFLALLFSQFCFAQQIDSTQFNQYVKKLVQEEVQKEMDKKKEEHRKLLGDRIKFNATALIRVGEWDIDQNSINPATGVTQNSHDRFWSRFNFYLAASSKLTDNLDVYARIRTGHKQYSFVTFGENVDERLNIITDEVWLDWKPYNYVFRVGRQSASRIWSNQKGAQFDIPAHDGISIVKDFTVGKLKVTPKLAYFVEYYRNNASLKDQGKIYGASLTAAQDSENVSWKVETGIIRAEKLPNRYLNDIAQTSSGAKYHDGDLAPEYSIWISQVAVSFKNLRNLTFKGDYYHNFAKYSKNPISNMIYDKNGYNSLSSPKEFDATTAPNFTNQRQGFVIGLATGNLSVPKNIYAEVAYLYLEKYAAMDYFAQYDFARWTSSNIKGPEFVLGYRFNKYLQFRARYFVAKEVKGLYGSNTDYKRSADRLRLDFNITF